MLANCIYVEKKLSKGKDGKDGVPYVTMYLQLKNCSVPLGYDIDTICQVTRLFKDDLMDLPFDKPLFVAKLDRTPVKE